MDITVVHEHQNPTWANVCGDTGVKILFSLVLVGYNSTFWSVSISRGKMCRSHFIVQIGQFMYKWQPSLIFGGHLGFWTVLYESLFDLKFQEIDLRYHQKDKHSFSDTAFCPDRPDMCKWRAYWILAICVKCWHFREGHFLLASLKDQY